MRIVLVKSGFDPGAPTGGVDLAVGSLASALQRAGDEVTVMAPVIRGPVDERCHQDGVKIVSVPLREASAILRRLSPDLVHLHGLFWPAHDLLLRRGSFGRPVLLSPHGSMNPVSLARKSWRKRAYRQLLGRAALARLDAIHALNQVEAEHAQSYAPGIAVSVIPNGIGTPAPITDRERSDARSALGASADTPVVLYLGRDDPGKGISALLGAHAMLPATAQPLLVIAGPSARADDRQVRWPGPAWGKDKRRLLAAADAFVLVSRAEGQPLGVLEALSLGIRVIVSDETNLGDFVRLRRAGTVVAGRSELAGALAGLPVSAPSGRIADATASVFEHGRVTERMRALYRGLCACDPGIRGAGVPTSPARG